MKNLIPFLILLSITLQSCIDDAKINIKNEVSNVTLTDIAFGNKSLSHRLLPGQSTETIIEDKEDKWPKSGAISFIMTANNSQIYLVTDSIYTLNPDDYLDITIDDLTPVSSF